MLNQDVINIAKKYIEEIPQDLMLTKAFLFGSCAKGSNDENSDIDIAVIVATSDDYYATQMRLMKLRRKFDLRIEPHLINEVDFILQNPLAYEIQKTGIQIY